MSSSDQQQKVSIYDVPVNSDATAVMVMVQISLIWLQSEVRSDWTILSRSANVSNTLRRGSGSSPAAPAGVRHTGSA